MFEVPAFFLPYISVDLDGELARNFGLIF